MTNSECHGGIAGGNRHSHPGTADGYIGGNVGAALLQVVGHHGGGKVGGVIVAGNARTLKEMVERFLLSNLAANLNIRLRQGAEGVSGGGDVVLHDSDTAGAGDREASK